jgi:type IV secretion system protein VirB2
MRLCLDAYGRGWLFLLAVSLFVLVSVHPEAAHASTAGGALPWDGPLTTLKNDLAGPVAFTISLLAMVACGAALVFGGEINAFIRRRIMLVLVVALITGVVNVASALGITGAVV